MQHGVCYGVSPLYVHRYGVLMRCTRTLIQVIDKGIGMSDTDARLSFERHSTSKIKTADDLFAISTMGFRGEALASIAAIAKVELKTRQENSEIGTQITIEGSKVINQEPTSCAKGSNFAVKNLFFNVPARRKFLKSNTTEFGHIISEFQRIALANPEVEFKLYHNDSEIYLLGYDFPLEWTDVVEKGTIIQIPDELQNEENRPCKFSWVFKMQGKE